MTATAHRLTVCVRVLLLSQVAACLQHATPQEVAVVQRSLADAEARAVAEEGAAAAAEEAAAVSAAEHAAAWSHHSNGQTYSVSSSADMSQGGFSAAAEQQQYSAYGGEHQAYMQQSRTDSYVGQQAQALAGSMAGLSLSTAAVQQHQLDQQQLYQQQYIPASSASSGQAGTGQVLQGSGAQPGAASMTGYAPQVQLPQQQAQVQAAHHQQQPMQHMYQHGYQQQPAQANSLGPDAMEGPRDVLGRPVQAAPAPLTGNGAPAAAPAAAPVAQAHVQPQQPAAISTAAALNPVQLQQPLPQLQQQAAVAPPSPQSAAAGAAAVAAAAAVACGDAGSQARHLTVLVHRLQSRPAEDVLAELAACASVLCSQAWQDNFSKVRWVMRV